MKIVALVVIVVLILLTLSYRFLPFRNAGRRRPYFAPLPKYKKRITANASEQECDEKLAKHGFQRSKKRGTTTFYTRGSILGDLSIELAKVDVGLNRISNQEIEMTVQSGWVTAFDTGDHWKLITGLAEELESA